MRRRYRWWWLGGFLGLFVPCLVAIVVTAHEHDAVLGALLGGGGAFFGDRLGEVLQRRYGDRR